MSEQCSARPLSVPVPVKNEAANLPGCIASVSERPMKHQFRNPIVAAS